MDPASRGLLEGWIAGVAQRPDHHCGVFTAGDGEAFGPRARPWDFPDILRDGRVVDDALFLELGNGLLRIDGVRDVARGEHAWGPGLRVSGIIDGAATEVWLV